MAFVNQKNNIIKNIIFDVGNVLILNDHIYNFMQLGLSKDESHYLVKNIIFCDEWVKRDLGTWSKNKAIDHFTSKIPNYSKEIEKFLETWEKYSEPISGSVKILEEVAKLNYNTFVLSNYPDDSFSLLQRKYEFFNIFNGIVVSARVGFVKPDLDIYHYILNEYNLNPSETIFIDDRHENIVAARELGINGILFYEPDKLKHEFKSYNIKLKNL